MKIHILFDFVDHPYGGGNQFLKALNNEFKKLGYYENDPKKANVILFNSHQNLKNTIRLKNKYSTIFFVHRVDGPMAYRGKNGVKLDKKIFKINSLVADGTVFQSQWSRQECYNNGMQKNNFEAVIHNAPDPTIFFPQKNKQYYDGKRKIKLISTSWSDNVNKGFEIYHYLDDYLDFEKYEMNFIGKTDRPFNNIHVIEPLPSVELAKQLRQHDIFIFASRIEACSNSLLEALHCGLPVVVRNATSNPELIGSNGLLFDNGDIIDKINKISKDLNSYHEIKIFSIKQIAQKYLQYFDKIIQTVLLEPSLHKNLDLSQKIKLSFQI